MVEEAPKERVVVIGVDNSEWSEKAFDYYMNNIHRKQDRVVAVHSAEPLHPPIISSAMASPEWKEHIDKHQRNIKDVEEKYERKAKESKLSLTILVVAYSSAGEAICEEAKKEHASLVVVGSRGAGLIRRTVLGSVSSYIVHHAHVPVLVCPKPHGHHNKGYPNESMEME